MTQSLIPKPFAISSFVKDNGTAEKFDCIFPDRLTFGPTGFEPQLLYQISRRGQSDLALLAIN